MKTENFDDAINQKLNSINPQYSDADIDKVHNFVKANTHISFAKSIYTKAAVAILGASVVALTIWNISQINKQQELSETIKSLKNNLEQPIAKTDTIYIKENISSSPTANTIISNADKNIHPKQKIYNTDDKKYTPINKKDVQPIDNKIDPVIEKKEEVAIDNSAKETEKNKPELQEQDNDNIIQPDSSENKADSLKPNIRPKKPISKKYILAGIGGSLEFTNPNKSFNIFGEFVFAKNWSAATGMKMVFLENEHSRDGRDWRDPKGKTFQQAFYQQLPPDSNNIKDINIRNALLLQLPIQVSYRYPISNNFTLLANIATDIEIYSKQKIDYTHRLPGNKEERLSFEVAPRIPNLNNISFSAGIQKQWRNNLGVQFNIYANKQFIPVPYRRDDLSIGARVRLFYAINI